MSARFIGLGKEPSFGSATARTTYLEVISQSVLPNQDYNYPDQGRRSQEKYFPGGFEVSGDIEFLADSEQILEVISAFTGDTGYSGHLQGSIFKSGVFKDGVFVTGSTYGGDFESADFEEADFEIGSGLEVLYWIFKPKKTLFSTSLEIGYGMSQSRLITGCVFPTLAFDAGKNEPLFVTLSCLGSKDTLITETTPTFRMIRPFIFFEGSLEQNGSKLANVTDFEVSIDQLLPDDFYHLGSRFLTSTYVGALDIGGSATVTFTNWEMYERFLGKLSTTEPTTSPELVNLRLYFKGLTVGGWYRYLEIYIPEVNFVDARVNFEGREEVIQLVEFAAQKEPATKNMVEFKVYTDRTSIWS